MPLTFWRAMLGIEQGVGGLADLDLDVGGHADEQGQLLGAAQRDGHVVDHDAALQAALQGHLARPGRVRVWPGRASKVIWAGWPAATRRMVVSSTAASTCSCCRSARVTIWVLAAMVVAGIGVGLQDGAGEGRGELCAGQCGLPRRWTARRFLSTAACAVAKSVGVGAFVELGARIPCRCQAHLRLLDRQLRLRHIELGPARRGVRKILLRLRQRGARHGHLGRCRLRRQLPLRGNLRQVRLDFSELLLLRRDLLLLFEIGLVFGHQLLKIRDAALVPTDSILQITFTLRQAVVCRQDLLALRDGDIVLPRYGPRSGGR